MTLEQLRVFVCVAEREHMTRAAETLNLTQSATSAAIAALEERHGVKLFDRIGRRIALTGAGRAFLGEARAVLARAATAEQTLADLAGLKTGALAIAASQTVGSYWLPRHIAAFHARYPGVAVALRIGNTDAVAELTRAGEVDLGFVEGEVDDPALDATAIDEDELLIVAAAGARDSLERLDAERLAAATWVAREKGSGTRAAFESALAAFGIDPARRRIGLELPSNEAICAAVAAGAGLAVMSRLVVDASIKAGELAAAPLALPRRRFFVLRHRQRYESQAARAFSDMLTSVG
ncbi:MAG: LysR substrate-binding domain-containing protein [Roseiarcus sp.]|uniref:LysR substrate-binding domain-containing protein n=1 Tax=Roseiarcus sp. TaxID=1969460 RepID=UPI003C24B485